MQTFQTGHHMHGVVNKYSSWIWKGIRTGLNIIRHNVIWEVKNEQSIISFIDNWTLKVSTPLHCIFPILILLSLILLIIIINAGKLIFLGTTSPLRMLVGLLVLESL